MDLRFFLVTTDHLSDRLWFRDEGDFIVGMNYVPVVARSTGIGVFAFILMSNHVHFVLEGTKEKVTLFINKYKGLYSYVTLRTKAYCSEP